MGKVILNKHTIDSIKKIYPLGSKVEALKVNCIPKGMTGIVWNIETSGDLVVKWGNGDTTTVERGTDSVRIVRDGYCMLGRKEVACGGSDCKKCGWNNKVHNERVRRIRQNDLKERDGGIRYLAVNQLTNVE